LKRKGYGSIEDFLFVELYKMEIILEGGGEEEEKCLQLL
jgi:hypothetical protein